MDINYELYKVFFYVATTLSFSEASKQLFISQSAVSQSIKALEKKIGPDLIHPEHKTCTANTGRRDSPSSCGTCYEPDQTWRITAD